MARFKTQVGDPVRLGSLQVIRRKVTALRSMAPDQVGAVFNAAEIAVIRRLAEGERIRNIRMTQEQAKRELRWMRAAKRRKVSGGAGR